MTVPDRRRAKPRRVKISKRVVTIPSVMALRDWIANVPTIFIGSHPMTSSRIVNANALERVARDNVSVASCGGIRETPAAISPRIYDNVKVCGNL